MNRIKRERQVIEEIRKAFASHRELLCGYTAVLFGSRADGTSRERSDFDIGIKGDQPLSPKSLGHISDSLDAIETLYKIDLVDLQSVSRRFRNNALQSAEVIYE